MYTYTSFVYTSSARTLEAIYTLYIVYNVTYSCSDDFKIIVKNIVNNKKQRSIQKNVNN